VTSYRAVYKHLAPMILGNSKYNTVSNTTMHPTINDYPAEQMHPAFFLLVITDLVDNVKFKNNKLTYRDVIFSPGL